MTQTNKNTKTIEQLQTQINTNDYRMLVEYEAC